MADPRPPARVEREGESFVVPAEQVAEAFGLEPAEVQGMLRAGRITTRTERGEGDDAGRHRLSFFHAGRVLRLTVGDDGAVLSRALFDAPGRGGGGEGGGGGGGAAEP